MYLFNDTIVILNRHPYAEADLVLSVLGKKRGHYRIFAKGVRSIRSRRGGHLDLFNLVEVSVRSKQDFNYISEAKVIEDFTKSKSNIYSLRQLYYVAELMDKIIPEGEVGIDYFIEFVKVLYNIEQAGGEEQLIDIVQVYEVGLLKQLGYWSEEIQGQEYPSDRLKRKGFNRKLIEQVAEKRLRSDEVFNSTQGVN